MLNTYLIETVKYVSDKNYVDKKDLSEYAKQYGISQESLLKYFNDKIGISISLGKVGGNVNKVEF